MMLEAHNKVYNAGKHLKPYQGLKQLPPYLYQITPGRKTPKTLSGIETYHSV